MRDLALGEPGFRNAVQEPGLSLNGFINSPASATVFLGEKTFEEMRESGTSGPQLAKTLQQKYAAIKDAFIAVFPPPPVQGLGKSGGFKLQIEDRGDAGYEALSETVKTVVDKARKAPELAGVYSTYNVTTPQLFADVDRTKAAQLGVDVDDIFKTMQIYLGSLYVNDFNKFGRTYQVIAQGDKDFRSKREDILGLKIRNVEGKMVPLGAVVSLRDASGPDSAARYNGYRSADINGGPAPGYSTGQAQAAITKILNESLTGDMTFEWTELTYQQILAGNTALIVFPICILLVFLVLTAQYESVFLPLAIILIVPMCLFSAIAGVWLTGGDNNLFTQIGFFVLIGLACKNAILIGEFARELEIQGKSTYAAAVEAAHLRLRPILMTSIAFIAGVLPLVLSHGAGAEMRHAMGVAVFFGMIGVTFFGLFLTPIFYVMARALEKRITRTEKVHHHVEA
jgi:multidrug efflux pump